MGLIKVLGQVEEGAHHVYRGAKRKESRRKSIRPDIRHTVREERELPRERKTAKTVQGGLNSPDKEISWEGTKEQKTHRIFGK